MLTELAGDPDLRLDMNFMPGDIQFLHNHTILHARSAYEDWPEAQRKRHLFAAVAFAARRPAASPGLCGMLRRPHDRRSWRHHLQGNAAACTAHARLSNDADFRWLPERKGLLACAKTEADCDAL